MKRAIKFNLKYRKADIAGRFHGSLFTNYSSTGGRKGAKLPRISKWSVKITNFTIASFGAAIQSIANGQKEPDAIINSIITGRSERVPHHISKQLMDNQVTAEEASLTTAVNSEVFSANAINNLQPGPVPISEFCNRPENIDLKSICN